MTKKQNNPLENKQGIWVFTGAIGSGKTWAAMSVGSAPSEIALFNFDVKETDVPTTDFGFYRSYASLLNPDDGGSPAKLRDAVVGDLNKLPKSIKVIIFDVFEATKEGMVSFVMDNSGKLGKMWAHDGKIANMQKQKFAKQMQAIFLDVARKKVDTVIVTTHLKSAYQDRMELDYKVPEVPDEVKKVARAYIWLEANASHPCPVGLVVKNISKPIFENGRIRPRNILPPKLSPDVLGDNLADVSVWDVIDHYIDNPVGSRDLKPYEQLSEWESAMIQGSLTEGQKRVLQQRRELLLQQEELDMMEAIQGLLDSGVQPKEVVEQLKPDFPNISFVDVMKAVKK